MVALKLFLPKSGLRVLHDPRALQAMSETAAQHQARLAFRLILVFHAPKMRRAFLAICLMETFIFVRGTHTNSLFDHIVQGAE